MPGPTRMSCKEMAGGCLAARIRVIDRAIQGIYDDALRPLRVRMTQLAILVTISEMGDTSATDIAEVLWLDRSTLSRNLDRIEKRGWVRIEAGEDARTRIVRLTASGRRLIERAGPAWRRSQEEARALMGDRTSDALRDAGTRLMEAGSG